MDNDDQDPDDDYLTHQLREQRRRDLYGCDHHQVTIATRPWCSLCGAILPHDHPMAKAALKRLHGASQEQGGAFGESFGRIG